MSWREGIHTHDFCHVRAAATPQAPTGVDFAGRTARAEYVSACDSQCIRCDNSKLQTDVYSAGTDVDDDEEEEEVFALTTPTLVHLVVPILRSLHLQNHCDPHLAAGHVRMCSVTGENDKKMTSATTACNQLDDQPTNELPMVFVAGAAVAIAVFRCLGGLLQLHTLLR